MSPMGFEGTCDLRNWETSATPAIL